MGTSYFICVYFICGAFNKSPMSEEECLFLVFFLNKYCTRLAAVYKLMQQHVVQTTFPGRAGGRCATRRTVCPPVTHYTFELQLCLYILCVIILCLIYLLYLALNKHIKLFQCI